MAKIENHPKISTPERIHRILERVSEARLPVYLRAQDNLKINVRARSLRTETVQGVNFFHMSEISNEGMQHLVNQSLIQVEFVLLSTKVVFIAPIHISGVNSIAVKYPDYLVCLERRKNPRVQMNPSMMASVRLSLWHPTTQDLCSPPVFHHFSDIAGLLQVGDISPGGLSCYTRFPSVIHALDRGVIDKNTELVLPMTLPMNMKLEVRWIKKTKELVDTTAQGANVYERYFKFGCQFIDPSTDQIERIKIFMSQITQAVAI